MEQTANRSGNNCLCSTASGGPVFMLVSRGRKWLLELLCSWKIPPTCSEICIMDLPFVYSRHCANCCFYVVSPWVAILLNAEIQLSLALPPVPVLSQLTFKVPDSKSHWLYKLREVGLWFLKPDLWRFIFLCGLPGERDHFFPLAVTKVPCFLWAAPDHHFCPP